jgi:uncharacterized protein (DUF1501 family)
MVKNNLSRRQFLHQGGCAALGSVTFLSSVLNLGAMATAAARPHILGNPQDYKALVCILLSGGWDSHNVLVPTDTTHYNEYQASRGNLALNLNAQPAQLLPLDYNSGGRTYAVHSAMPDVRQMFDNQELSFISNVGTLVEPVANVSEYNSGLKKLPLGLYSHSDQIMHWQTSVPQSRSAVGVGGRIADLLHDMNSIPEVSLNISLSGKNRFQAGNETVEFAISRSTNESNIGFTPYPSWWSDSGYKTDIRNQAISNMMEKEYLNIFHKTLGSTGKSSIESIEKFRVALANVSGINTSFSGSGLSQDLKKIAELMSVRTFLGVQRQIFFVNYGGWDHHDNLNDNLNNMLPVVNNALHEFNEAMIELGLNDQVVTFTISDFARTLTSNGNGSDHAWGSNQIVMGGAIQGKQIFGTYPSLSLTGNPLNVSARGRLIPTTSVDELFAEMALWFGVSPNDLSYILPNLCHFYSPNCPSDPPVNYMPIGIFT